MTRTVSFYDAATGQILGATFTGPDHAIELNTPAGCLAIEGEHDHLSRRVDLETGEVVDWQPPAPDEDHEWNPERKRWLKRPEVVAAEQADQSARAQIAAAELAQLRPLRELLLNPNDAQARTRLQQLEETIAAARPQIKQEPR